jgi:hypothetical protein
VRLLSFFALGEALPAPYQNPVTNSGPNVEVSPQRGPGDHILRSPEAHTPGVVGRKEFVGGGVSVDLADQVGRHQGVQSQAGLSAQAELQVDVGSPGIKGDAVSQSMLIKHFADLLDDRSIVPVDVNLEDRGPGRTLMQVDGSLSVDNARQPGQISVHGVALPPPFHNPVTKYSHWYHGTANEFYDEHHEHGDPHADDPTGTRHDLSSPGVAPPHDPGGRLMSPDRTSYEYGQYADKHWNSDLGVHFTSHQDTAEQFAGRGQYQDSRVAHCALHMANPKHYRSEYDLAHEAIEWAHGKGYHYLHKYLRESPDTEDHLSHGGHYSDLPDQEHLTHLDDNLDGNEVTYHDVDKNGPGGHSGNVKDNYLTLHPDREAIVSGFRQHLQDKGHDGIIYGNEYEPPAGHACAIPFDDHRINMHRWQWLHPDAEEHHNKPEHAPAPPATADEALVSPSWTPEHRQHWVDSEHQKISRLTDHFAAAHPATQQEWYHGGTLDGGRNLHHLPGHQNLGDAYLHIGTKQAALERIDPDGYSPSQGYAPHLRLYRVRVAPGTRVCPHVHPDGYYDDDYHQHYEPGAEPAGRFEFTGADCGDYDAHRYVNDHEAKGSTSMVVRPHLVRVEEDLGRHPKWSDPAWKHTNGYTDTGRSFTSHPQRQEHMRTVGRLTAHFASAEHHPLGWEGLDEHLQRAFHPQQLEARQEKHPKSGHNVDVGERRRLDHVADDVPDYAGERPLSEWSAPARLKVVDFGPDALHRPMLPTTVGYEPLQHVYRGVSMEEYHQAKERGYLQSDLRGVISANEGTNAATDPRSAISYLPPGQRGMVLKIKARPEHDWRMIHADDYVRTANPIPMSDVEHAEPYSKSKRWQVYSGHVPDHVLDDERKRHEAAIPLYRQPKPEFSIEEYHRQREISDEHGTAWADQARQHKNRWQHEVRRALSRGDLEPQEAWNNGYKGHGHDQGSGYAHHDDTDRHDLAWEHLPQTLWHVTTNKAGVLADDTLKSRRELSMDHGGSGLGGGEDDTISLTHDLDTARHIHRALHEYHAVVTGKKTVQHMVDEARQGGYLHHVVGGNYGGGKDWKDSDPLPERLREGLKGRSSDLFWP